MVGSVGRSKANFHCKYDVHITAQSGNLYIDIGFEAGNQFELVFLVSCIKYMLRKFNSINIKLWVNYTTNRFVVCPKFNLLTYGLIFDTSTTYGPFH